MAYYLRNILQLILAPHKAWAEIADDDCTPSRLLDRGLYPLLGVVALTAFCHGLYSIEDFDIVRALESAVAQFVALFISVLLGRALFEAIIPALTAAGQKVPVSLLATVPAYCMGVLAIIQIIGNLCPVHLLVLDFLPAILVIIFWQAHDYLYIDRYKYAGYAVFGIFTVIVMPLVLIAIFKALLSI